MAAPVEQRWDLRPARSLPGVHLGGHLPSGRVPRAAVTWALTLGTLLALAGAGLYLLLPASSMPSLVPGIPRTPGWDHRYLQAAALGLLAAAMGATALVHASVRRRATEVAVVAARHD